ncbi:nitrilase-related carbon-nitrogen hydrolase [Mycolicibacterium sediminis]|uniref:CN hydrolase domain-containing protein n=1 Tax=Mycolicibacterium sediminis TaxID=1286180 RepID=A0A7I7QWB1_9MYCO|nr:nitrilase-related carbon-nitrogen hydrolase [Mycolicibacterium sediminis]BBY30669.1 hypothetical protein MSEDJ_47650 [Mycolicibacterium sediminis]
MPTTTVAIIQQPSAVLDLAASLSLASHYVTEAARKGASLVVFPETWLTCNPAYTRPDVFHLSVDNRRRGCGVEFGGPTS